MINDVWCGRTAQACHWFDWNRMWPEAKRVLRKGGSVAFWVRSSSISLPPFLYTPSLHTSPLLSFSLLPFSLPPLPLPFPFLHS